MRNTISMICICLIMVGCSGPSNEELARQYKLDLQYFDRAISFANLNMNNEALASCGRTSTLRNECFSGISQLFVEKNISTTQSMCNEIKPEEAMNMTMGAFELVYPKIDASLEQDLLEKMRPSRSRISAITSIKRMCEENIK